VSIPVNSLLQRLANRLAATSTPPGSVTPDEFDDLLAAEPEPSG